MICRTRACEVMQRLSKYSGTLFAYNLFPRHKYVSSALDFVFNLVLVYKCSRLFSKCMNNILPLGMIESLFKHPTLGELNYYVQSSLQSSSIVDTGNSFSGKLSIFLILWHTPVCIKNNYCEMSPRYYITIRTIFEA